MAKTKAAKGEARRVAILGGGNIGQALARGLAASGYASPEDITITRRNAALLKELADGGFNVLSDNHAAVRGAHTIVVAVQPGQIIGLLDEIRRDLDAKRHVIISVVSDVPIKDIRARIGDGVPVVRAMPNTAIAIRESMSCLAGGEGSDTALAEACALFGAVGRTVIVREELMTSATALCACGIAFFLRAVRAASQGGIQIGFHPEEALTLAAQTARGAASLLLTAGSHPESEIDKVTTPRGCTIAGLNEMEHQGFSSAMIKGILVSADRASKLFDK